MIPGLLLIAALAHLAPQMIAQALGHPAVAWEAVLFGLEATALWIAVDSMFKLKPVVELVGIRSAASTWMVCCYGAFESIQRPACRLMHPMGERLVLPPGQTVCGAAGIDTAEWSAIAACLAVVVVAQRIPTN